MSTSVLLDAGCDGVLPTSDVANNQGPFMSPAMFRRFLFPWLKAECDAVHRKGGYLEHKGVLTLGGPVPDGEHLVPFGQAAIPRQGRDVTIFAIAFMVHRALEAAEILAQEGIEAEVIDPRTLAPLDIDTVLASVHKTGRLLVVDEDFAPCGMAAEVAVQVMERGFDDLDAPVRRLTGLFAPAPYSPALFEPVVPSAMAIVQTVRDLLAE